MTAPQATIPSLTSVVLAAVFALVPRESCAREATTTVAMPSLEAAFWRCDYEASEYGIDRVDADACAAAYEALKQQRFGGDFDLLLAWWERHRAHEHARLRDLSRTATSR